MVEKAVIIANKRRVKEIFGGKCANWEECGSKEKPHIHHLLFKSDLYPEEITESKSNYIALCNKCERLVHKLAK